MTQPLTIIKNLPCPPRASGRTAGKSKYPIHKMEIGDSFKFPKTAYGRVLKEDTIRQSVSRFNRQTGNQLWIPIFITACRKPKKATDKTP